MKQTVPGSILIAFACLCEGLLFPKESETRAKQSLDGIWNFRAGNSLDPQHGFVEEWYKRPLSETGPVQDMPVPSSFNDITTDAELRDYSGWVWYDRTFFVPKNWVDLNETSVWLRFGSVHYTAIVWVNGQRIVEHNGGHLPFEAEVTDVLLSSSSNMITVAVNNTLSETTIPQGYWHWKDQNDSYPPGYFTNDYTFDFFNYAGIHRPVVLYTVPKSVSVSDVTVTTNVSQDLKEAVVNFIVDVDSDPSRGTHTCLIELLDANDTLVASGDECEGNLSLSNPKLWWPYLSHPDPGYLYTLMIRAMTSEASDVYRLSIGLRQVTWDNNSFKINHQDFYFRGFGWHEDGHFRGKGLDLARATKDFNLIKWTGANSFRTSHYPYAEEIMDFADRNGIVVIDECPGVNLEAFDHALLDNHLQVMEELVSRDKNRPSVVMWSIANEARSIVEEAKPYFETVSDKVRQLDPTRPVTLASAQGLEQDKAPSSVDIIMLNRYFGWYSDTSKIGLIYDKLLKDLRSWRETYEKPIMIGEYGADTMIGLHEIPSTIWTEEFQTDFMLEYFKVFDKLRSEEGFVGEHIWNFADFMTKQETRRVWGNRKGIFTRERHPKSSAHLLRARYFELANEVC